MFSSPQSSEHTSYVVVSIDQTGDPSLVELTAIFGSNGGRIGTLVKQWAQKQPGSERDLAIRSILQSTRDSSFFIREFAASCAIQLNRVEYSQTGRTLVVDRITPLAELPTMLGPCA